MTRSSGKRKAAEHPTVSRSQRGTRTVQRTKSPTEASPARPRYGTVKQEKVLKAIGARSATKGKVAVAKDAKLKRPSSIPVEKMDSFPTKTFEEQAKHILSGFAPAEMGLVVGKNQINDPFAARLPTLKQKI